MARKKFTFSVNNISELRKSLADMAAKGIKLTTTLPAAQGRPPLRKLAQELNERDDVLIEWSQYFPEALLISAPVVVTPPSDIVYAVTAKVRNKLNRWNAPVTVRITLAEVREILGSSSRGKVSNGKIVAAVCHKQSKAGKLNWTPSGIELVGDIVRETPDTVSTPAPVVEKTSKPAADKPVKQSAGKGKEKITTKPQKVRGKTTLNNAEWEGPDTKSADPLDNIEHPADAVPAGV